MLGVGLPVKVPGTGGASDRKENVVIQRLVCRAAWNGKDEREMHSLRAAVRPRPEWLLHQRWLRGDPELAVGRIGHDVKQRQVLGGSVVHSIRGSDAGFSRTAENLTQQTSRGIGRICQPDARPEFFVIGGR